jgi:Spy/CpxP family protein refolding chaperone
MPSTRRFIALGAVLAVAASGSALAETMSDHHAMGPGQTQEMMRSGQHPMGSSDMQRMMRQHHPSETMPMGAQPGMAKSAYAGQDSRNIKALSEDDIASLQNGDGMGMAKAAELNGYPGPRHVLAFAKELRLTDAQADQTNAVHDRMSTAARPLGAELIDRERLLDQLFAKGEITPERLTAETSSISDIQGRLRAVHLSAHLETRAILTPEQVALYDKLRGYTATGTSSTIIPTSTRDSSLHGHF